MSALTETILATAQGLAEGAILSAKSFLHLGSRAAIDQALTRLKKQGTLLRISRGTYVIPIETNRFGKRPPSPQSLIKALHQQHGEIIVTHGAHDANTLGLTTQQPIQEIFLTSGRSRVFNLGARTIRLQHGAHWQLAFGQRPAGMAIRALACLGPKKTKTALQHLHQQLSREEWRALCQARSSLPAWMATAISHKMETKYENQP